MDPVTLLAEDKIKWTDVGTFVATAIQTVVVAIASAVALQQYLSSLRNDKTRLTLDYFQQIGSEEFRSAAARLSQHLDYLDDWPLLITKLEQPVGSGEREACEADIWTVTNLTSKLWRLYKGKLINRQMLIDEMDEYMLQIASALSAVHLIYTQPDYSGLFKLAVVCQKNYEKRAGRYSKLRDIPLPKY